MTKAKTSSVSTSKKAAVYGMFLALALVAAYIERMLPLQTGIPGVKLGLPNIITMVLLYTAGPGPAVTVTVLRILLSGLLFGSGWSMVYSAAGAALSLLAMWITKKTGFFSAVGVSIIGGVCHNVGQILVAMAVLSTKTLILYLPVLILSGLAAGLVIGVLSGLLSRRLLPVIRNAGLFCLIFCISLTSSACGSLPGSDLSGIGTKTDSADAETWQLNDFVMSTVLTATVYGSEDVTGQIKDRLDRLEHDRLSWRDEKSTAARVNREGAGEAGAEVEEDFVGWVDQCLRLASDSEGAFDPSIGRLTRLWDIEGDHPRVPDREDLDAVMKEIGYEGIHIDRYSDSYTMGSGDRSSEESEDKTAEESRGEIDGESRDEYKAAGRILLDSGRTLDLGAVGKGIACDQIREYLEHDKADTVTGAVVSVGGSILVWGDKPDGSDWTVAIQDPRGADGEYMGVLSLNRNTVVSTSGDYEKYFEEDGVRYHHILDPHTGYPADSGLISVTVVCRDGLLSDGLSTACFVLGADKGMKLLDRYGAEGIFIDENKKVTITDGIRDRFSILNNDYKDRGKQ